MYTGTLSTPSQKPFEPACMDISHPKILLRLTKATSGLPDTIAVVHRSKKACTVWLKMIATFQPNM